MSAEPDSTPRPKAPGQRRAVRLFVGLHLAAVAVLYAIAMAVGGGLAGPPMPAVAATGAATTPASRPQAAGPASPEPVVATVPAALPAWTQRAELSPPWEAH